MALRIAVGSPEADTAGGPRCTRPSARVRCEPSRSSTSRASGIPVTCRATSTASLAQGGSRRRAWSLRRRIGRPLSSNAGSSSQPPTCATPAGAGHPSRSAPRAAPTHDGAALRPVRDTVHRGQFSGAGSGRPATAQRRRCDIQHDDPGRNVPGAGITNQRAIPDSQRQRLRQAQPTVSAPRGGPAQTPQPSLRATPRTGAIRGRSPDNRTSTVRLASHAAGVSSAHHGARRSRHAAQVDRNPSHRRRGLHGCPSDCSPRTLTRRPPRPAPTRRRHAPSAGQRAGDHGSRTADGERPIHPQADIGIDIRLWAAQRSACSTRRVTRPARLR